MYVRLFNSPPSPLIWFRSCRTPPLHRYSCLSSESLKRFNPQVWLPTLTLLWGIVSVCQGLVTNKAGLFGIRFREYSGMTVTPTDLTIHQFWAFLRRVFSLESFTSFPYTIAERSEVGAWLSSSVVRLWQVPLVVFSHMPLGKWTASAENAVGNGEKSLVHIWASFEPIQDFHS